MVLPSTPVSVPKGTSKRENRGRGSKGWSLEEGNGLSRYIDRIMGFHSIKGSAMNSKGPIALPPKKKEETPPVELGGREEEKLASYIRRCSLDFSVKSQL